MEISCPSFGQRAGGSCRSLFTGPLALLAALC